MCCYTSVCDNDVSYSTIDLEETIMTGHTLMKMMDIVTKLCECDIVLFFNLQRAPPEFCEICTPPPDITENRK